MTVSEIISVTAAIITASGFGLTLLRGAQSRGQDRQRIKGVEERMTDLEASTARYATAQELAATTRRIDSMDSELREALKALSEVKVISTQLTGLDRLMTRELDEIKHSLRNMRMVPQDPPVRQ